MFPQESHRICEYARRGLMTANLRAHPGEIPGTMVACRSAAWIAPVTGILFIVEGRGCVDGDYRRDGERFVRSHGIGYEPARQPANLALENLANQP